MAGSPAPQIVQAQGPPPGSSNTIAMAAAKYGVPMEIMVGVFGLETNFGDPQWVKDSSAGARGFWQFIKSTAAEYNYPYTNERDPETFKAQTEAAAKYLSTLYKQKGSWDAALRGYSGGGYGLDKVRAKARENPAIFSGDGKIKGLTLLEKAATGPLGDAAQAASDALSVPAKFLALLTSLEFWLRLGQGIAGLILIAMGLKTLTGYSVPTPIGRV